MTSRTGAWRAAIALLPLALAACTGFQFLGFRLGGSASPSLAPTAAPAASASPSADVITGGVETDDGTTPTVRPTAPPSPSPSPGPDPTPYVPIAVGVTLTPQNATISVAPPAGASPLEPYTDQIAASVLLSNGIRNSDVTWQLAPPTLAQIDSAGLLTALDATGTVVVTATSRDGLATATTSVTIEEDTQAEVIVQ